MQSFQLPEGGLNSDGSFDAAGQLGFSQGPSIFNVDQGGFSAGYKFVFNTGSSFTFSNATVPEPPTWAMMLTGFAGLGFIGYRGLLGQRG